MIGVLGKETGTCVAVQGRQESCWFEELKKATSAEHRN